MRTVEEHRSAVLALVAPTPGETVPLADAAGRVLARDVRAEGDLPRWDCSAMDGYAVRGDDVAAAVPDHPVELRVVGDLPAGSPEEPFVHPGTAVRIMTGAPVPPGADAVVPVEHTDGGTAGGRGTVRVGVAPRAAAHIRRAGEDVRAGDVVVPAGTRLGPRRLAAAASAGAVDVVVHRRPRFAVLSTGSELVPPGPPLARGQIRDSNSVLLAASVAAEGCDVVRLGSVPDDADRFRELLDRVDGTVDLLVTSGGVSVGAYDVVKEVLAPTGVEFLPVAVQPGKPQGVGRLPAGTPVVCLPGNPVSVHVCHELFVRPALLRLLGAVHDGRPEVPAVVTDGWTTPPGRAQYMPVAVAVQDGRVVARRATAGGSGSHLAAGLARADGLAVVPADVDVVRPGDTLTTWRTDG